MSIKKFKETAEYKCSSCYLTTWMGNNIVLEVDHINGNNKEHELCNLRYLCPNCHSQTTTWRGRNINTGKTKVSDEDLINSVKTSNNVRQALIKVGLTPKGANYSRVSNLLDKKQIDFKNSQFGTVWVNNGISNKKIKQELLNDYLSSGFIKGRIATYKIPSAKGKIWITNGIKNKMVLPGELPEGFWRGKFQK